MKYPISARSNFHQHQDKVSAHFPMHHSMTTKQSGNERCSIPFGPLLSQHHQSRGEARELPRASFASRIKLDVVQARLYVVRAGDAGDRKSAGCTVSPVRARIASLHHLEALSRTADAPYTAAPRFSTRPSMSAGASVTLQSFSSGRDPR